MAHSSKTKSLFLHFSFFLDNIELDITYKKTKPRAKKIYGKLSFYIWFFLLHTNKHDTHTDQANNECNVEAYIKPNG